jgi:hypothetical protein
MGMGANVIAATASLGLPRIGVGPVVDLFGGLSWLADAAAYVVFGSVLLLRRDDVQPSLGILVGITAFLRAASALALAVLQPLEIVLSLPDFLFLHMWQITSVVANTATGVFFIVALARRMALR